MFVNKIIIMKKILLSIAFLCVTATVANAQALRIGVKGGLNYSTLEGKTEINYKEKTSFHGGLVAQINLLKPLYIQPEVYYSSQGAKVKGVGDFNFEYVNVPVLAKLYIIKDIITIEAGPQFSFNVGDKKDNTKDYDFGIAAGLGAQITDKFFIQGRYVSGLIKVEETTKATNTMFQLSLGYFLN